MSDPVTADLAPEVQAAIAAGRTAAAAGLQELRSIELPLIDAVEPGHMVARLLTYGTQQG